MFLKRRTELQLIHDIAPPKAILMVFIYIYVLFVDVFESESKSLKEKYEEDEKEWWEKFGDTDQGVEINKLEKELKKLYPEYH